MADHPPLTTEDYAALHALQMSDDPASQAQAHTLAVKMTPQEHQAFFDYQKTQHPQGEHGRVDNQVLGMPPEMVAAMALPVMKTATQAGLTVGKRIGATMKSALGQAHPLVKYEITRSALEHLGIPPSLAMATAIAVSGYKTGNAAPAAAGEAATTAGAASPAAAEVAVPAASSGPVPVAPPAATAAAAPSAAFNHGQAMNDVRGLFKQLKVTPGPAEVNNAASMMKFGKTAEEAVLRVLEQRPGLDPKAATALAAKLGTPSDATVSARVAARNATGRWGN
jgi:hypothetical protein